MKKGITVIAIALIIVSCSRDATRMFTDQGREKSQSGRYDYLLTEALRQKYLGEMSKAVDLFEKCIKLDKERSVPYFELAPVYAAFGMAEKSMEYARKAADMEEENYWYQLSCGTLHTQFNKKDTALIYFQRALNARPGTADVMAVMAGLYSEKGEGQKADSILMILDRAGVLDENMFMIMIAGLIEEKNLDEAAKRVIRVIESKPSDMKYRTLLAEIYREAGRKEECDSIYKSIIESDPENAENQILVIFNMINDKKYESAGEFLMNIFKSDAIDRERKIDLARELINDSVYIKSNEEILDRNLIMLEEKYLGDEEVASLRPVLYENLEMNKKAIERYEDILKTAVNKGYFQERLIILYAGEQDYEKLYNLASEYATNNNRSIIGKIYYAIAAMELKQYDIADRELKKALILAGNESQLKAQVLSLAGDLKYRMKELDQAYSYLEEAYKLNPDDIVLLNNYAYFLAEGNRELSKALKMAEKVMEKEGENPTYVDTYAWVLYKLGRYKEAWEAMLRVAGTDKANDPEILEHMGFIQRALKDCGNAVIYWQKAIDADSTKTYLIPDIEKCKGR